MLCQIIIPQAFSAQSAGALPQTPLGSLQRSLRPPSWKRGMRIVFRGIGAPDYGDRL